MYTTQSIQLTNTILYLLLHDPRLVYSEGGGGKPHGRGKVPALKSILIPAMEKFRLKYLIILTLCTQSDIYCFNDLLDIQVRVIKGVYRCCPLLTSPLPSVNQSIESSQKLLRPILRKSTELKGQNAKIKFFSHRH